LEEGHHKNETSSRVGANHQSLPGGSPSEKQAGRIINTSQTKERPTMEQKNQLGMTRGPNSKGLKTQPFLKEKNWGGKEKKGSHGQ